MNRKQLRPSLSSILGLLAILSGLVGWAGPASPVLASHTPDPGSVNLVGDLQSEVTNGVCGDWDPVALPRLSHLRAIKSIASNLRLFRLASGQYKVAMGKLG